MEAKVGWVCHIVWQVQRLVYTRGQQPMAHSLNLAHGAIWSGLCVATQVLHLLNGARLLSKVTWKYGHSFSCLLGSIQQQVPSQNALCAFNDADAEVEVTRSVHVHTLWHLGGGNFSLLPVWQRGENRQLKPLAIARIQVLTFKCFFFFPIKKAFQTKIELPVPFEK